jgi:surface carbohydrate biosynthesis protein
LAVLDTEGGLYGDLADYAFTITDNEKVRAAVGVVCAWGPRTAEFLTEKGIFGDRQVQVTGVPRFDFYAPGWRSFFDDPLPDDEGRPLVLVNTKVAVANPQHHSVEEEVSLYVDKLGFPPEQIERLLRVGRESIAATNELVNRLAIDLPDLRFVLRPHPHERTSTYADAIAPQAQGNLSVIREGTVDAWIVRSSALIHRQCTTAIEARLAGVPALAPMWVPTAANAPTTEEVSIQCERYDDLVKLLISAARGSAISDEQSDAALRSIEQEELHRVDGESHRRVAAALLTHASVRRVDGRVTSRYFFRANERALSRRGGGGRVIRAAAAIAPVPRWSDIVHPAVAGWPLTPKAFSMADVAAVLEKAGRVESYRVTAKACTVSSACSRGLYRVGYRGHGVVITEIAP